MQAAADPERNDDAIPLADAAKAHEQSETRQTRGKIVLEVVKD